MVNATRELVATYGSIPVPHGGVRTLRSTETRQLAELSSTGETIHVHDLAAVLETEFPEAEARQTD